MGLDFLWVINFESHAKSQKNLTYISKNAGKTEERLDRQKHTFHGTTTLHPGPIKQEEIIVVAEEVVFTQTLTLLSPTS